MDNKENIIQPGRETKKFFKVDEVAHNPKFESSIPPEITHKILEEENITEVPELTSSIVEDFVIQQLQEGEQSEEDIINNFFTSPAVDNLREKSEEIKNISDRLDWDIILSNEQIENIKNEMVADMRVFEIDEEKINQFENIDIVFTDEGGVSASSVNNQKITVDRLQIVRRTMDYLSLGQESSFEEIARAIAINTIAHELGHQVQVITGVGYNLQSEWKNDVPSERFAEGWARHATDKNQKFADIVNKLRILQVAKVNQVWEKVKDKKIDLTKVFNRIIEKVDPKFKKFLESRYLLYGVNAPENYALPYSFEAIKKELMKK